MSYDYTACKRSLECLFGLDALGKIESWYKFATSELRCFSLVRKLVVKITCGDWYPPIGHRTKEITASGECTRTATAGADVVQSGRPIFDDIFQHLWPYIGNNTANVVFQMVKRLWLIRIDQ
ncbi:hypothetical protein TNCV_425391 [Trichonephila clavipes]|nr:hypothetical protein TNCV_425391 [Trichonephila clavipes]